MHLARARALSSVTTSATTNLLRLRNVPILDALKIEEALFRADDRSWLIVNEWDAAAAAPALAVVLGISGKPAVMTAVRSRGRPTRARSGGW